MAALVAILGANLYSDQILARNCIANVRIVDENLAEVRVLAAARQVRSINLLTDHFWDQMWLSNFLIDKHIDYMASAYAGRGASPLNAAWDLVPKQSFWDRGPFVHWKAVDDRVDLVDGSRGIEINSRYRLARRHELSPSLRNGLSLSVRHDGGWKTNEQGQLAIDPSAGPRGWWCMSLRIDPCGFARFIAASQTARRCWCFSMARKSRNSKITTVARSNACHCGREKTSWNSAPYRRSKPPAPRRRDSPSPRWTSSWPPSPRRRWHRERRPTEKNSRRSMPWLGVIRSERSEEARARNAQPGNDRRYLPAGHYRPAGSVLRSCAGLKVPLKPNPIEQIDSGGNRTRHEADSQMTREIEPPV